MMLRLQPAHILMNLGVSSGLNHGLLLWPRNFGMTRVAMITYKTKMRGSMVMDCGTCNLVRVDRNDASTVAEKKFN
jgi:hypothetical protein